SESEERLIVLDQQFNRIIEKQVLKGLEIKYKLVGERPSGSASDQTGLIKRISAIREQLGLEIKYSSGSTDANIPMGLGLPAISFGVCNGGGAHTSEEYIEIDSLDMGLKQFLYFIVSKVER
ncbi:MAG: M20/M25/M40 family metallo-hydrolase, partial [Spirochaetales bacterium]|nr:M20/M25/M40 family metallo-hydrolase [Spirochaetales bacterium]